MAIINGPYASKMRGKVGEVVAAKTTGNRTAIRSYQPTVKNPNTLRQRVSRGKMAEASTLAAVLSEVLKIGYAKAASGTNMYPRNLFVKSVIPTAAGVLSVVDGKIITDVEKVKVSYQMGIGVVPLFTQTPSQDPEGTQLAFTNANSVILPEGSTLGVVVVLTDNNVKDVEVICGNATEGVLIPLAVLERLQTPKISVFYKEIPEAYNGVESTDIPWKYPSLTGPSSEFTTVN